MIGVTVKLPNQFNPPPTKKIAQSQGKASKLFSGRHHVLDLLYNVPTIR
jgi:hypothetical protein